MQSEYTLVFVELRNDVTSILEVGQILDIVIIRHKQYAALCN